MPTGSAPSVKVARLTPAPDSELGKIFDRIVVYIAGDAVTVAFERASKVILMSDDLENMSLDALLRALAPRS